MRFYKNRSDLLFAITCFLLLSIFYYIFSYRLVIFKSLTPDTHALSPTTTELLKQCDAPLTITLHTKDIDTYHAVKILIERYQLIQPSLSFQWIKQSYPFSAHYAGNAIEILLNNQKQIIDLELNHLDEAHLTQALFRLQRKLNKWIVFLQGHDEPNPFGTQAKDFALFRTALENQGLKTQALNLQKTQIIANNTQVLIIASPKTTLLPIEEKLISQYIAQGNDLLWLMDPHSTSLPLLSQLFGIKPLKGTIVDLHGQKLKTPHPAITIIDEYPALPFSPPKILTAFPFALALSINEKSEKSEWTAKPLLMTNIESWTETSDLTGNIGFEPENEEVPGPLSLGVYLTRLHPHAPDKEQRIVIIGNSRFLSNGAIENYGNLALGLNMLSWLNHDDALLTLTQPISNDSLLQIHFLTAMTIQYLYPLFAFILILFAFYLQHRRSKRRLGKIDNTRSTSFSYRS